MNEKKTNWPLIVGGGVLVGLLLVACLGLAWWGTAWLWGRGTALPQYRSNGAQIYFTATSQRGTPITSDLGMGMGMMRGGATCANCHGPDGRGGRV